MLGLRCGCLVSCSWAVARLLLAAVQDLRFVFLGPGLAKPRACSAARFTSACMSTLAVVAMSLSLIASIRASFAVASQHLVTLRFFHSSFRLGWTLLNPHNTQPGPLSLRNTIRDYGVAVALIPFWGNLNFATNVLNNCAHKHRNRSRLNRGYTILPIFA